MIDKLQISGIYCILNIANNSMYVGSAVNLRNRRYIHLNRLRKNKHDSIILQNAYNKHGEEKFQFNLIEIVSDKNDLLKREQVWIDFFNPKYNVCKIAGSRLGKKCSAETRRRISNSQKGRKVTELQRQNISNSLKGRIVTQETRNKISKSKTGEKRTQEQVLRMRIASKGRIFSEEAKKKLRDKPIWNKGKKMSQKARENMSKAFTGRITSEETKLKLSKALKGRKFSQQALNKLNEYKMNNGGSPSARLVINSENGIFYNSIKEAYKSYGFKQTLTNFGRKVRGAMRNNTPFIYAN